MAPPTGGSLSQLARSTGLGPRATREASRSTPPTPSTGSTLPQLARSTGLGPRATGSASSSTSMTLSTGCTWMSERSRAPQGSPGS
eukprot:2047696-Pyramimonas_sp.AAC.1